MSDRKEVSINNPMPERVGGVTGLANGSIPAGCLVAFFGADGSGKSTVIDRVQTELSRVYPKIVRMHFRPSVGQTVDREVVTEPHAQVPRGPLASAAKLAYYLADYNVGYALNILPGRRHGTMFLSDRYYHDIIVDPVRYRFGAPVSLVRNAARLIPYPDLMILLDAPPDVLQARKREVSMEESERAREGYLQLFNTLRDAFVVDSSRPLNVVVADVVRLIGDRTAARSNSGSISRRKWITSHNDTPLRPATTTTLPI